LVDVLNPDVVAFRGRYLMYFSGNDSHTENGRWRTGLAVASSPTGPFRVHGNIKGDYFNGGTTAWHRRLWHVVEDNPNLRAELASSSDGIRWRHESFLSAFSQAGLTYHGADFFLEDDGSQLNVYMLAYPPSGGIGRSLAFAAYASGPWSDFHIILSIKAVARLHWASADLGEPAVYDSGGRRDLLFVGLDGSTRIGLHTRQRRAGMSATKCPSCEVGPRGGDVRARSIRRR
jgi:hypothetical protein